MSVGYVVQHIQTLLSTAVLMMEKCMLMTPCTTILAVSVGFLL